MHPLILLLIAVTLGAAGQLFLKQGMGGIEISGSVAQQLGALLKAILRPFVLTGIICYVVSLLFWLKVLSTQELSYVYPMIAISYVTVTVLSVIFLHERVSVMRWFSLGVICLGVAMLAVWGQNKAHHEETPNADPIVQAEGDTTSAQNSQTASQDLSR